jgi:5-methylcytosine-specific restriction endonuclease McrA
MKFELTTLPRNSSDDDVLAEIRRVDLIVGKNILTQTDYNKHAKMTSDGVKLRFGSWEKALTLAGLENKYTGVKVSEKMRYSQTTKNLSDQEVLDEVRKVANLLGGDALTMEDFNKNSEIGFHTLIHRFGSWQGVLQKAGLEHKYSGKVITENMKGRRNKPLTDEDVLVELKRIAKFLNKETVSQEDVKNYSNIMSLGVIVRRFGSFVSAIQKAGLKISEGYRRAYTDDEYFENLLNVWTKYGRQPVCREMDIAPSKIKSGVYRAHFGSWHKSLESFVARMNNDEREIEQVSEKEKPRVEQTEITKEPEIIRQRKRTLGENRRDIGLSLRYKVLSRDNFKCVRCGRSPATNIGVELHIDHKLPFSMGGKTIFENLETKCKECNLGKSNRHLE